VMPPPSINQSFLHPQPTQTATSNSGRLNEFYPYPRGGSLPPNIVPRPFYSTTYSSFMDLPNQNPFIEEQISMANMASGMPGQQMPTVGPYIYGQTSGSDRPTPDEEEQDDNRKSKRRTVD
jgi:hypothetical protein